MLEYFATTVDNPFDPFTQFKDWERFDEDKSYYTNQKIARLLQNEAQNIDPVQKILNYNNAVERLIAIDFLGLYKRVSHEVDLEEMLKEFD